MRTKRWFERRSTLESQPVGSLVGGWLVGNLWLVLVVGTSILTGVFERMVYMTEWERIGEIMK